MMSDDATTTETDAGRAHRLIVIAVVLWTVALSLYLMLPEGLFA